MKILIINFEYPPLGGGGGVATRQLAEYVAAFDEVHVLTTGFKGLPSEEKLAGVNIHRVSVLGRRQLPAASFLSLITFVPAALWKGFMLFRAHDFCVINAQFVVPSGVVGRLLSAWFRVPLIVSFIGGDVYDPTKGTSPHRHGLLRALVRFVARGAAVRTAISKDTRMRARDLLGVQGDIEILPVGFTAPVAMVRKNRRELGLPEGVPLVVGVGRLIARKRYDMFLAVLQKLPNVHGVIVGEGQLRSYLEDRAKKLGVNERVHFLGFVSDDRKWEVLESADVYLSTAEHEGFGIVFLEAMAAGLPVVAVSHGGQEDFLVHEKNGFFAGVGEEAKLPGFIETLLADNDLRKDIGRYNRLYVERYKDTHVGEQFLDILRRVTKV